MPTPAADRPHRLTEKVRSALAHQRSIAAAGTSGAATPTRRPAGTLRAAVRSATQPRTKSP